MNTNLKIINQILENLTGHKTVVTNRADQTIIKRRKERIESILQARSHPYLGRMDVMQQDGKRVPYYVGKTSIGDEYGENEIVIDWRSDFGKLYTTYSGGKKHWPGIGNLIGKRQITMDQHRVNRVVDVGQMEIPKPLPDTKNESILIPVENVTNEQFLNEILSHTAEGFQLQEIISSLQEEQDEIIRLPIDQPVVVQGVAGSGKSSVALHRISYLLFQYEKVLKPEHILVVAPNRMFISYMQSIIPELDIQGIQQDTFIGFALKHLSLKTIQPPHLELAEVMNKENSDESVVLISRFKNSMAFQRALQRYMDHQIEHNWPKQSLYLNASFSLSQEKIHEIYKGYQHLPINHCREQVLRSIKNLIQNEVKGQQKSIEEQFELIVQDWVQALPEGSTNRKTLFVSLEHAKAFKKDQIAVAGKMAYDKFSNNWESVSTLELYNQLFDKGLLMGLVPDINSELADLLCAKSKQETGYEDLAALLYIENRLNGIKASFGYMVIDEAQDLSPFQLFMLKQFSNSVTILGDITQSIYPTGIQAWSEIDEQVIGTKTIRMMQMETSYRSTYEIMSMANQVIENSQLSLPRIIPVNRKGGKPVIQRVADGQDLLMRIKESLDHFIKKGHSKVAIIGKDLRQTDGIYRQLVEIGVEGVQLVDSDDITLKGSIILIPSYLVKGMEFDAVIIPNANDQRFLKSRVLDTKLMYICITRAHHDLHVYYHGTISPLLKGLSVSELKGNESLNEIL
ncbi:UvrD-helicase domain-containing protein [Paenibacillus sp. yr247]|uniref:HelD family protein n=1 Tax=Paenibacillus sp. yr247 TaxID=1761880 RepID=UPI001587B0BD|nr:UvrD-helicase domain-containing protein [Paenibacillus sp. yr247]